jgi:hypothetical protein
MADESATNKRRWRRVGWVLLVLIVVVTGCAVWFKQQYPYGESHNCSKGLGISLRIYANDNDDWYPHGMSTPEASLSLLVKRKPTLASLLRGKHLSQATVEKALLQDGELGPNSCGWHYIEGLRESDSPQLAVAWDRVTGLDHQGRRRSGSQHEVVMVDGSTQFVSKRAWPNFVANQKRLLAEASKARTVGNPVIRWSDEETLGPNTEKAGAKIR